MKKHVSSFLSLSHCWKMNEKRIYPLTSKWFWLASAHLLVSCPRGQTALAALHVAFARRLGGKHLTQEHVKVSCWCQGQSHSGGFGENLGEFTSVTPTPFLCEILVGKLRCHCWLTSMTVGKQRYRYRCETSEHFKAALRHFSAARKESETATECLRHG